MPIRYCIALLCFASYCCFSRHCSAAWVVEKRAQTPPPPSTRQFNSQWNIPVPAVATDTPPKPLTITTATATATVTAAVAPGTVSPQARNQNSASDFALGVHVQDTVDVVDTPAPSSPERRQTGKAAWSGGHGRHGVAASPTTPSVSMSISMSISSLGSLAQAVPCTSVPYWRALKSLGRVYGAMLKHALVP